MTPYNFAILLFAFCSFMLSLMVWFKRQDSVGNIYFVYSFFVTLWGITFAISLNEALPPYVALFYARLLNASAVMIGPTWHHFCSLYTNQYQNSSTKNFIWISYISAGIILIFTWTPWFVPYVRENIVGYRYCAAPGPIYYLFTLLFIICVCNGFAHLFHSLKKSSQTEKHRTKILILAKSIGFIGGGLTFLPVYGISFPQYGVFLMPLYPFATAYLISVQKLFDVEELAQATHQSKLEAIGILSASINHELRNPLYIIKNFSESLSINTREGVYTDFQKYQEKTIDTLDRITRQSNQAMKIIGRLTAFARKKPDQDFKMVAVSLKDLVEDLDILIRCEIETYKIEIVQDIPEDLPQLLADPAHLEEILLNLILNAYQVLKNYQSESESKKQITISAKIIPQAPSVLIIIKDNGPGISPDDLSNIFKPFYTKKKEGLGLGLYITKQLVEKNQGTIKIESKPGQGAAFILEFNKAS